MRLSKGMTQEQAAAKGELPFKRWQLVERGTLDIHLSTLARVARALGVPAFFLLMPMHGRPAKRKPGRPASASPTKAAVTKKPASQKKKSSARA